MAEVMQHIAVLADEIGPRPATSEAESRAASYLESVFSQSGLQPEVQEFEAPRTYGWAYILYNFLTILAAVGAGVPLLGGKLVWVAFILAAATAIIFRSDLNTRWGLTRLMPKGPSQNVIARHIPRARRGERLKKIVIVAHYDSARSSLAFSPGMARQFPATFALMKWATTLVPVLILALALPLPIPVKIHTYVWYATLVVAAYLIVPLLINLHRELAMPFVAGANDNASGVAAMLGVMSNFAEPQSGSSRFATVEFAPVRRTQAAAVEADVVPEGAVLSYTQSAEPPARERTLYEFETIQFEAVGEATSYEAEELPYSDYELLDSTPIAEAEPPRRRGLLGMLGRKKNGPGKDGPRGRSGDVKGWLGVDEGFNARKAGREIGSWDNFGSDEEDDSTDGFGWKGGQPGGDPLGDEEYAAHAAARIRRHVTERSDHDLTEKEVWFVATGAEEVGTCGMQAFLGQYGNELRDALIINLDNVGAGQLSWVTAEGMGRRYGANQRLVGLVKRVSREEQILVKPRVYKGLSTDASPALARGFKAMSIMAFDNAGLPLNWHWHTDTVDRVESEVVNRCVELVTAMIRKA
ncbi:MAG: M28 family peptidase [Coriobacteriia bacterium]|nr:M28 family peptidase [Coriobacteriia bacterium]